MARNPTLAIKIVSDASGASRGFAEAENRVGGFERSLNRASIAAAGVVAGMAALARQAFDAASAAQQSTGAIEAVFGAQAEAVKAYAAQAAQAVGLSRNSYQELASVIGSQLNNMGVAHDQLVPKTNRLITLGADLAAMYGGTTADAVAALSSLLRGETDPIERYGVSIKAADISARLAAQGLDGLTGAQGKAAQANAVLGLLAEQTGTAVGTFAREIDTAAGQSQIAAASWEDAKASLGESLLPIVSDAAQAFSELTGWMTENEGTVQVLAIALGALAAVVWTLNIALYANPIVAIGVAIGAAIIAVGLLWAKFEGFRDFVKGAGEVILWPFERLWELITWIWEKLQDFGGFLFDTVTGGAFSAPASGGSPGGGPAVFGAAGGTAAAPMFGAAMGGGVGGSSPSAGSVPAPVVININGALDPVAVGRQVERVQRQYGRATATRTTARGGRV